jgi:hypothetical protein
MEQLTWHQDGLSTYLKFGSLLIPYPSGACRFNRISGVSNKFYRTGR